MLNTISWSDYVTIVAVLLTVYYITIGIKFFSLEFRELLSDKILLLLHHPSIHISPADDKHITPVQHAQAALIADSINPTSAIQEGANIYQQVEELTVRLKEAIKQAADKNFIREEFVLSLRLVLKTYAFMDSSPFLVPINNLIRSECEKYGYIQLSAEEQVMLWSE